MSRSHLCTSLVLITSLASGCAGNGGAVTGEGGANQADPQAQKEPTSDSDTDGLPADQDLCPGTADGAKVDGNGCSADQRAEGTGGGVHQARGRLATRAPLVRTVRTHLPGLERPQQRLDLGVDRLDLRAGEESARDAGLVAHHPER